MSKTVKKEGNRIEKINNAKYIAIINNKEYPIFFSYGLKKELFNLITESYLLTLDTLSNSEVNKDTLNEMTNKISLLEGKEKELAIQEYTEKIAKNTTFGDMKRDLTLLKEYDTLSYQIVSMVLTQRNEEGKIEKEISVDSILYSQDFAEADNIIEEIYELVMEKYQDTAKKNTTLMTKLLQPASPKKK